MIVDVNVNLSRWPFRRLPGDETPDLVARLRRKNVVEAWAGSYDGLLHRDIGGVNARLAADCAAHGKGFLVPFGEINPMFPDWREDVRRCQEEYRMPGIRLHPNYHGYALTDRPFVELFRLAGERQLIVQIALSMEDIRTQHPLMRVPPVSVAGLADLVRGEPGARLVLLNWRHSIDVEQLKPLADAGEIYFDLATLEGIECVARLTRRLSFERVLFGSNSPFFPLESAALKVKESALPKEREDALLAGNAKRILPLRRSQ